MDELGFRTCRECGKRALIELAHDDGWICARCYVRRRRMDPVATRVASETLTRSSSAHAKATMRDNGHFRKN
jgi:hypothetical protein